MAKNSKLVHVSPAVVIANAAQETCRASQHSSNAAYGMSIPSGEMPLHRRLDDHR